jgi:parallel beta-helix repeat protein
MYRKVVAVWVSLLFLLCTITIVLEIPPKVTAATITVDDDGPAHYVKIQDAINSSTTGDTIYVHSGTYRENLNVNKTISLTGENKETTIIDGMRKDNTIYVTADYVNISGFTIYNSSRVWANPDGGIKLVGANHATIEDNICTGDIIGILLMNSNYNTIRNNKCNSNTEQGICLRSNSGYNIVKGNEAKSNRAGIVLYSGCSYNTISHNNASSNTPYHGINLDMNNHWNNITNNYVGSNSDEGIYLNNNNDNNQIRYNTIISNGDHGVLLSSGCDNNKIYNNNFFFNTNQATDGGTANVWDNGYPDGGNYWSNFDEPGENAYDDYMGVDQDINGSDGIVDQGSGGGGGKNPYNVPGGSQDNYPFIEPIIITLPSAPQNPQAIAGDLFINVSWEVPISSGSSDISGYNVYRSDVPGVHAWVPANQLWFYETNVQYGITYTFNVSAENADGEGPRSDDMSAKPITTPSAPRNPYTIAGDGFINLYWEEPSSDGGSPITEYIIYRGATPGVMTLLDMVPKITYYIDSTVVAGFTYYYKISAVNFVGEGPLSVDTQATIYSVPTEPINLVGDPGDSFVNLDWEAPASNGGSPITGYLVYRNTPPDETLVIFDVGNTLSFNDSSAKNGVDYEYLVSAENAVGEGPQSTGIMATPYGNPSAPLDLFAISGDSFILIHWQPPVSDGGSEITGYNIYREDIEGLYKSTSPDQIWYNDTDVLNSMTYIYYVSGVNAVGEGPSSEGSIATPMSVPSVPTNLQLVAGDGYVICTWNSSVNDGGSQITGYRLYRGETPEKMTLLVDLGPHYYFNDTETMNNNTYYYCISAKNSVGESFRSDHKNGTPRAPVIAEIEEPPEDEPEDIPLWLLLLHIIIIAMVIMIILLLMNRKGKGQAIPKEQTDLEKEVGQEEFFTQTHEEGEEPPLPPPPV